MSKLEKAFWGVLILAVGIIIGGILYAMSTPRKIECNSGIIEEVKDGKKIRTYLPALDTCVKEQK